MICTQLIRPYGETPVEATMSRSRARLADWRSRLKSSDAKHFIPDSAIDELCAIAKQQVQFYFRRPKQVSPAAASRELDQMAKGLQRAEKAIRAIGTQGITRIYAASRANADIDEFEPLLESSRLLSLSRWAKRAAPLARAEKRSHLDGKRGPTRDANLYSLVTILAQQYLLLLGIRPTHGSDVQTGAGTSLFDDFVKCAISDFAPASITPKWAQMDEAIRHTLHRQKHFSEDFGQVRRRAKKKKLSLMR
jgi:hypothetical protein